MKEATEKKVKILWSVFLLLAWTCVLLLLRRSGGRLTIDEILSYEPENTLAAMAVMTGLFLLKSVDFILHSGILYGASGVLFPLPLAIVFNLFGVIVMVTPPYFIGKSLGAPAVEAIAKKHPKIKALAELQSKNELAIAFLLRISGMSFTVASVYMGASRFRFGRYLLGSVTGILPLVVAYTVMGTGAGDKNSPVFWTAFGICCAISVLAATYSAIALRRSKRGKTKPDKGM